jgi:hypothetical protein
VGARLFDLRTLSLPPLPAFLLLYVRRWVDEPALWVTANCDRREAQKRIEMGGVSSHDQELVQFTLTRLLRDPDLRRRVGLLILMSVTSVAGWWSASTWLPQYAAQLPTSVGHQVPLSPSLVGLVFSLGSIAGFLGLGFSADIIGRKPTTWLYYLGALQPNAEQARTAQSDCRPDLRSEPASLPGQSPFHF